MQGSTCEELHVGRFNFLCLRHVLVLRLSITANKIQEQIP